MHADDPNPQARIDPSRRLDFDAHCLLVAIAQVHRYAKTVGGLTRDIRARTALDAFHAAVPRTVELRG